MKQQRVSFRHGAVFDTVNADRLPRSETDHGFIVEVVFCFSVIDGTSHRLFQKQRIESERHLMRRLVFRTVEMYNTHQRMPGLKTKETIVLFNGICFYYFHTAFLLFAAKVVFSI